MALNSSRLPDSWCSFLVWSNVGRSSSVYHHVILTTCVVTALLAPMTVTGNALIMAAIWRNPSLRTPSYVLLAGLAVTDFCSGLLSQPFFVMNQLAGLAGNIKLFCIGAVMTSNVGYIFSCLTVVVMTIIAVERWLHMSRRSLLTARRVVILYITSVVLLILLVACNMYNWYKTDEFFSAFIVVLLFCAALCFSLTIFAYLKVFQIKREHQSQVQTNQNAIDIQKYKKSVFTILNILAVLLLSYVPFMCCLLVISIMDDFRGELSSTAKIVCAAIVLFSSFVNPLLYYRRIKEIRDSVRSIVRNLCSKGNGEES